MPESKFIWHNGKFVRWEKAQVHIMSHALHYGSGVFEGIRAYETAKGTAIFRLKEHVDRLFYSAAAFEMKIPYSKKTLSGAIKKTITINNLKSCYIRPIIFYGEGQMGLGTKGNRLHVAVAAWPWGAYLGDDKKLSLCISPYARFDPRSIIPGAKISGYYATSILASLDAHKKKFDECVLLDHEGFVAEGPGENIFIVKRGKLYTPDSPSILKGITRASVLRIARDLRIPAREKKISLKEFMAADEAFLTGTAAEVAPIGKIDRRPIGNGSMPITQKIRAAYLAALHGKLPQYRSWLTFVR